jgi:hypothetical protein
MTRGARDAINDANQLPLGFLARHSRGDWGDVDTEDWQTNERGCQPGSETRLLSVYYTATNVKLYVITEWDRSVTTMLLPSEY